MIDREGPKLKVSLEPEEVEDKNLIITQELEQAKDLIKIESERLKMEFGVDLAVTIFAREGKYYWMYKSMSFDTFLNAAIDAINHIH